MVLEAYTYVFAIGSCFALLEAYNNGASMCFTPPSPSMTKGKLTFF